MDVTFKYNYYDVLELNSQCTQNEIVSAYEKLKTTYSGDNPAVYTVFTLTEAREMLTIIEEAFSVLGNKGLRQNYDEKLNLSITKPNSDNNIFEPVRKSVLSKPIFKVDDVLEAEFKSCLSWDGEMLKKVREYKGWKLDRLAEYTKISAYYIKAIEQLEPKNLPAPVFVRGYISQLSKILGLDEKKVCDSYMKVFKSHLESK